ncbi:MAG: outer membrane beta-barrel protein [Bacteroidales bacterium]|nr:outer membrane beta-barrel protein [Bacteroidales bacterium]
MKTKILTVLMLFCLSAGSLFANENEGDLVTGEITGKIIDGSSLEPIAFASVSLLQAEDLSLITGVISDDAGEFVIGKVPKGNYKLKVSFIGYKPRIIENISITRKDRIVSIDPTGLEADVVNLTEVSVTQERLKGEEKVDRTVFTINDDIRSASTSGVDLLKHIPSVSVDFQDNVTIEGQSDIQFFVDGVLRNKDFVAQLSPEVIDKVELITNPGVKYDSDISAVVNIVLKKNRRAGVNGSVLIPAALPDKLLLNPRGNIEFGNKNMRIYVGDRLHYERFKGSELLTTQIDNSFENPFYYEKRGEGFNSWQFNYMNYGVDIFLSEKTSLNLLGEWRSHKGVTDAYFSQHSTYSGENLTEYYESYQDNLDKSNNHFHSAFFRHTINDKGSEITAELNYYTQTGANDNTYTFHYFDPEDQVTELSTFDRYDRTENLRTTLEFKSDYSFFIKEIKNEAGIRLSERWMNNDFAVTNALNISELKNEEFHYTENWNAAYYNIMGKVNTFSWQAGVRLEYTGINIEDTTNITLMSLLPQVSLSQDLGNMQSVKLTFRRKLYKPGMSDLNPFTTWTDSLHVRIGNPDLRPAIENRLELSYSKNFGSNYLSPKLYFRYTENGIQDLSTIRPDGVTEISRANIGRDMEYGVGFSSAFQLFKFFRLNSNVAVYNREVSSNYDLSLDEDNQKISFRADGTALIFLPKEFVLVGVLQYQSPSISYQREFSRDLLFLIGVDKQIGEKMHFSAFYNPFIKDFKYSAVATNAPGYSEYWEGAVDVQHLFAIEFTYNFSYGGQVKKIERDVEYDKNNGGGKF